MRSNSRFAVLAVIMTAVLGCSFVEARRAEAAGWPNSATSRVAGALCRHNNDTVRSGLAGGVSPNASDREGAGLIFWAIKCQNAEGLDALLSAGGDPNATLDPEGPSALMVAATYDDQAMMRVLIKHGADMNYLSDYPPRRSALKVALVKGIESGNWANYYDLINAGADINAQYPAGDSIAVSAARLGQMDKVLELLDRGYGTDLNKLALAVHIRVGTEQLEREKLAVIAKLRELGVPYDEVIQEWKDRVGITD